MTTVLMTTDAVGGVWSYSLELADALAAEAVDVVLVVLGPAPSDGQRAELRATRVTQSFELDHALEWMPDPWSDVDEAGRRLLDVERQIGPDVVHLNGYVHATMAWSAPTVVVAHSDVLSWWRAVHGCAAPASWSTYATRVGAGLKAADAVVAPTAAMLDALRREHEFPGGSVIPNGRRADWAHVAAKEPLIVGVGRMWDAAKNLDALAAAAAAVEWPVVLLGAGSERPASSTPAPYVGLGAVPSTEVAQWLARATIFAAPARYEPFGLAALEAARSGCALVLGDIPTQRELWGDAAVFVHPARPDDLSAALRTLSRDPDRCADLGQRARQRSERYTPDAMARSYVTLYRSLHAAVGGRR